MSVSSLGRRWSLALLLRMSICWLALFSAGAYAQDMGNTLTTNQSLSVNQYLSSNNKQYKLVMQGDGNLALYGTPSVYLWGIGATAGRRLVMQGDGNLCAYPASGSAAAWCAYSQRGPGDYFTILRDTGDLEIYRGTPSNTAQAELLWTSLLVTDFYANRYPDLKAAFGTDASKLMQHWVIYGRFEGRAPRQGISDEARKQALNEFISLDTRYYALKYPDLRAAFGFDAQKLLDHYNSFGRREGRYPNQQAEQFQERPVGSANGRQHLRIGDTLRDNEFLVSPNKRWILFVQGDGNVCVNEAASPAGANERNRKWCKNTTSLKVGRYAAYINQGQLCTEALFGTDDRQRRNCGPMGEGPVGPYYAELQDDANFVIHKGMGPSDERGAHWDWVSRQPRRGFNINAVAESVAKFVVNTANLTAQQTSNAAVAVAHVTANTAVMLANETANAAVVAANATVNTANKVANDTTAVAVTVGRTVQDGSQVVGKEIVRNGEIVGYAVADVAVQAWNYVNTNCGQIGRRVFPIDGYFQGVKTVTGAVNTYGGFVPGSAELKRATDQANQCFEQSQDGFYCAFPAEIGKIVSQTGQMPGNLIHLATRVFNEAKTQECLIAGAATVTVGGVGLHMCAMGKVVVGDAQKAYACFTAAEAKGLMKKFYTPLAQAGEKAKPTSFPNEAACRGIGELAFEVAEKILTNGLSAEAKAAKAAGKSNTVAMVADQLRSVYKVAAAGAKYDEVVRELEALPECR